MFDCKKAIENPKAQSWDREEVERGDYFAVVVEEGQPALSFVSLTVPAKPAEIARDGRLGNPESQLEQFAVNARNAPGRILVLHAVD
jgi:hypothetical protein